MSNADPQIILQGGRITGMADGEQPDDAATLRQASAWVRHDLDMTAPHWASMVGTWTHVDGVISQTDDTADAPLLYDAPLPSTEYVVQADVRFPTGQDIATTMTAVLSIANQDGIATGSFATITDLLGMGVVVGGDGPGDDPTKVVIHPGVDADWALGNGFEVAFPQDEWHTVRGWVAGTHQVAYFDDALLVQEENISGGNAADPSVPTMPVYAGIGAVGLVDFRNIVVWTRALPA